MAEQRDFYELAGHERVEALIACNSISAHDFAKSKVLGAKLNNINPISEEAIYFSKFYDQLYDRNAVLELSQISDEDLAQPEHFEVVKVLEATLISEGLYLPKPVYGFLNKADAQQRLIRLGVTSQTISRAIIKSWIDTDSQFAEFYNSLDEKEEQKPIEVELRRGDKQKGLVKNLIARLFRN